jgi:hypothetical protein
MKTQIIRELGQADILLPSLVADGLAADDRIKVRMSALQQAAQHARQPDHAVGDLAAESRAAGMAPSAVATLIGGSRLVGDDRMTAPNLAEVMEEVADDAAIMVGAVAAGDRAEGEKAQTRLASIRAAGLLQEANDIDTRAGGPTNERFAGS